MERWEGKVAIVTGASSGIGAAIAENLVKVGIQVVGFARRKERLEELENSLKKYNGAFYGIQADITDETDVLKAFKWVNNNLGPVHILINNAGVAKPTSLMEGETQDFRRILDTNVLGLTIVTREAVKDMRAHDTVGHIIHINSLAGHQVPQVPHMNIYPASKYAVTALTETLRHELISIRSPIKVTSISPGLVDTEIFSSNGYLQNEDTVAFLKTLPKLFSKDIADAVIYILGTPPHVQVSELVVRPIGQVY